MEDIVCRQPYWSFVSESTAAIDAEDRRVGGK